MGTSTTKTPENNAKDKTVAKDNNSQQQNIKTRLVLVRIAIKSKFWEKTFNIEETLEKVANDFKTQENMDSINQNYFIEWTYRNSQIEMNSKKLKEFISEKNIDESTPIYINQEIKLRKDKESLFHSEIGEIFGKPLFSPFKILIVQKNQKMNIFTKSYNENIISETQLNKFSIESAYCNGNNHLFISGGFDPSTKAALDLFWYINLKSENLNHPIKMSTKKNHSMIYGDKKVFIVGGDDENASYYDIESQTMNDLGNLNKKRFEPSLIKHDNYLFCFDSSRKSNNEKYSLERINLNYLEQPNWEIIYPNIAPSIKEIIYNQKFFGLVEDYNQNIIFLGGIYDNTPYNNCEVNNQNKKIMNTRYNINKNIIDISDIPFQEISLSEKTFLPLDDKNFFIIPNFQKRSPKIVYYNRDKNEVHVSSFKSNMNYAKKKNNNYINHNSQIKASLFNVNFDMPGLHKEIGLNNNSNNKNNELNIINPSFGADITMNNPNLFISSNPLVENTNKFSSNINIDDNLNNNNLIEQDKDNNCLIYQDQNNDIFNKPGDMQFGININQNKKEELNEINKGNNLKGNDNYIQFNQEQKPINDNNNDLEIKVDIKEKETPDNKIQKDIIIEETNDIKDINNNSKDFKNNIVNEKPKKINHKKKEIRQFYEIPNNNLKLKFHNSVNDPCNIIGKIKVTNLPSPKYISPKMIKIKTREILKAERNLVRMNNY